LATLRLPSLAVRAAAMWGATAALAVAGVALSAASNSLPMAFVLLVSVCVALAMAVPGSFAPGCAAQPTSAAASRPAAAKIRIVVRERSISGS
jgi:hypothetical protein